MNESQLPPPGRAPRPPAAPLTVNAAVLALRDELRLWDAPATRELALEHFWTTHPRTPVLETTDPGRAFAEGQYTVTFLWQDAEAEEVLLAVNGLVDEQDLAASLMRRVPGSDVWQLSYRMRGDWRASYGFHRRLPGERWPWADRPAEMPAAGMLDPRNPRTGRLRSGAATSVVSLPDAPPQPWGARDAAGAPPEIIGPDGRRLWVHEPAGADSASAAGPPPAAILLDGEVWACVQGAATIVDDLVADRAMRPCLLVMVGAGGPGGAEGSVDSDGAAESAWIADRLLPWLRERYGVSARPADVAVAGQADGGYTALRTALEHPETIGAVLSQSATLWRRKLPAPELSLIHQLHAYIEVGLQQHALRGPNDRLASELTRFGCDTHFVEFNGGADYACWRGGLADGLRTLFGPPAPR